MKAFRQWFLWNLAALVGTHAGAETAAEQEAAELPEAVVVGQRSYKPKAVQSPKFTEPLRNTPQTLTVIPEAAMQEQGATTLRDVLRNVPGISIQAGEGGVPAGDNLSIRGFNARTDVFVDGVRDFGGYSRDPFNIEQIEVIKGPASSYAGRGSTGGSINMVSKWANPNPLYRATAGVGTDQFRRGTIDVNQPMGEQSSVRINAMYTKNLTPGRNEVENERFGVAPTLAFGLGSETRQHFGYYHLGQNNTPDYGIPWVPNTTTNPLLVGHINRPAPVDFDNFYGLKGRDYEKTDTDVVSHLVDHDVNKNVSVRNLARYARTRRDSVITAPRFATPAGTAINRQLQSRDQTDVIVANQTDVTSKFSTAVVEHSLVTGVELSRESSRNFARTGGAAPTADLFNPDPHQAFTTPVVRNGAYTDARAASVGVYAFDTAKIGRLFEIVGGVRWDSFDVDYVSVASGTNVATGLGRKDEMVSWRGGLVFKPTRNASVYASYGTSFNPSAEALTLANTATATNSINTDPEESETYEVGAKWDVADRILLTAAVFRTDKDNARTENPADPTDVIVLAGEQRVQGLEVGAAGDITRHWNVFGGFTYLDSEVISSRNPVEVGRELTNTPKRSVSTWTTYMFPWNIQLGGGVTFVDSRVNSTTTPRRAPSYWTADAMMAWQATENVTFRVNGYNLTNKDYIDRVGGGHFVPGAGRSATLTTEVQF